MDKVLIVAILAVILCSFSSIVAYFMIGKSNGETSSKKKGAKRRFELSEIEITDKPDEKSTPMTTEEMPISIIDSESRPSIRTYTSSEIEITDKIPDEKSTPMTTEEMSISIIDSESRPSIRTYTKSVNMDIGGNDIACYQDGSSADFCKEKCDNDTTCKGYNYIHKDTAWGAASGCCYKTLNQPLNSINGIDFYALN